MSPDEEVAYLAYCYAAAGDPGEFTRRMGSHTQNDFLAALRWAPEKPATAQQR